MLIYLQPVRNMTCLKVVEIISIHHLVTLLIISKAIGRSTVVFFFFSKKNHCFWPQIQKEWKILHSHFHESTKLDVCYPDKISTWNIRVIFDLLMNSRGYFDPRVRPFISRKTRVDLLMILKLNFKVKSKIIKWRSPMSSTTFIEIMFLIFRYPGDTRYIKIV